MLHEAASLTDVVVQSLLSPTYRYLFSGHFCSGTIGVFGTDALIYTHLRMLNIHIAFVLFSVHCIYSYAHALFHKLPVTSTNAVLL